MTNQNTAQFGVAVSAPRSGESPRSSARPGQRDWLLCFTDASKINFDRPIGGIDLIAKHVANTTGLSIADLRGESRKRAVAWPRQAVYYLASQSGKSSVQIAKWFGRDHASVLYGIKQVERRIEEGCQETARIIAEVG